MDRKLASIKRITSISDIEGKDRIGLALVDGWTVIVQKSEYKAGDLCIYCEIDSLLPERPEFEFLKDKGYRIRTMKMAGCISQGICFPLSLLPNPDNYNENDDVTDVLGIKKWEREDACDYVTHKQTSIDKWLSKSRLYRKISLPFREQYRKKFPCFIPKTDETRIQNAPHYLNLKDINWVITEKVDGQSGTFIIKKKLFGYEYYVCSRNLRLSKKDSSSYWKVSDKYSIEKNLKQLFKDEKAKRFVAIQGECIAPNVQGNKYKVSEPDLFVFNLIIDGVRQNSVLAKALLQPYGFKFVPILDVINYLPSTVEDMLKYAHGKSKLGDTIREGVVCRDLNSQISFKAVDPLFLIQYNE